MREVAKACAIDIALDEELIGVENEKDMVEILERSGAKYYPKAKPYWRSEYCKQVDRVCSRARN